MTNKKLLIGSVLSGLPLMLALVMLATSHSPSKQKNFDLVKCSVAYEQAEDKDKYMASVYDDIKDITEADLPAYLKVFVVKVKASQFGK